jgi:hypothetical protein
LRRRACNKSRLLQLRRWDANDSDDDSLD